MTIQGLADEATFEIAESQKLILYNLPWRDYLRLLRIFDERPLRLTYDRGTLEIRTLSAEHARYEYLLNRLIFVPAEELNIDLASYGSTSLFSDQHAIGIDPDECYWLSHLDRVRSMRRFDSRRYPPPDLVVEIDVTHSVLDRLSIYAALNVPEVWRYDGATLSALWLTETGNYQMRDHSRVFPSIAMHDVARYLDLAATVGEIDMVRQFRAWVRDHLV